MSLSIRFKCCIPEEWMTKPNFYVYVTGHSIELGGVSEKVKTIIQTKVIGLLDTLQEKLQLRRWNMRRGDVRKLNYRFNDPSAMKSESNVIIYSSKNFLIIL